MLKGRFEPCNHALGTGCFTAGDDAGKLDQRGMLFTINRQCRVVGIGKEHDCYDAQIDDEKQHETDSPAACPGLLFYRRKYQAVNNFLRLPVITWSGMFTMRFVFCHFASCFNSCAWLCHWLQHR